MKYNDLQELQDAYMSGELKHPVTLDNDDTHVSAPVTADENGKWHRVFDGGHPRELLEAALDMLGIPWQGA